MSETVVSTESASQAAIQAQIARLQAELAAAQQQAATGVAAQGQEFFENLVHTHEFVTTESTGRVGVDIYTVPFKVDGEDYTVTLHITKVAETAANKAILAAKKAAIKAAEAAALRAQKDAERHASLVDKAAEVRPELARLLGNLSAATE